MSIGDWYVDLATAKRRVADTTPEDKQASSARSACQQCSSSILGICCSQIDAEHSKQGYKYQTVVCSINGLASRQSA